jgi:hypothetical protein
MGSSPRSDTPAIAPAGGAATPTRRHGDAARWRAVFTLEWRQQWREPLTTLYALVFLLLTVGFTTSGAVDLVNDRGTVPKDAPWTIALAFGGLTAFGQVITTMIATTAMLRDEAGRTRDLLATTGLDARTWWSARLTAAGAVMLVVYAAMPVGMLLGRAAPWIDRAALLPFAIASYAVPFAVVTLPTVAVVATALAATASLSRRVLFVLATALLLLALWQMALALAGRDGLQLVGALLDPFANAPLLVATAEWTEVERATRPLPVWGVVAANRIAWLSVAAVVGTIAWRRASWTVAERAASGDGARDPSRDREAGPVARREAIGSPPPAPWSATPRAARAPSSAWIHRRAVARFTAAWILRDGGWRVVMALALLNAFANALARPLQAASLATAPALLALVAEHARLFTILLATVYAGELVWRERDVRADALVDALPVTNASMVTGRLAGVFGALALLTAGLAATALVAGLVRGGTVPSPSLLAAWALFALWTPFAQLTVLSLAVHALVRHKVAAHLLLITGWVVAVVLDRSAAVPWWLRFGESAWVPADRPDWGALAARAAWWWVVCAALVALTVRCWPRGQQRTGILTSRR